MFEGLCELCMVQRSEGVQSRLLGLAAAPAALADNMPPELRRGT